MGNVDDSTRMVVCRVYRRPLLRLLIEDSNLHRRIHTALQRQTCERYTARHAKLNGALTDEISLSLRV